MDEFSQFLMFAIQLSLYTDIKASNAPLWVRATIMPVYTTFLNMANENCSEHGHKLVPQETESAAFGPALVCTECGYKEF